MIIISIFGRCPEVMESSVSVIAELRRRSKFFRVRVRRYRSASTDAGPGPAGLQRVIRPGPRGHDSDQSLSLLSACLLERLDSALAQTRPDLVVVQGETTTALTGTLAAFYRRIAVAHAEAGRRTGNMQSPWPEEMNRRTGGPDRDPALRSHGRR